MTGAILEYDRENRILHLTASEKLDISTKPDLENLCCAVTTCLAENSEGFRSYMVVNISAIAIDPKLMPLYMNHVARLMEHYLYENGIIRYGFEVTRITARAGHASAHLEAPDFFWSKVEALEFVKKLLARRRAEEARSVPVDKPA